MKEGAMTHTFLEWHRLTDTAPEDETLVLMALGGETDTGFLAGGIWYRDIDLPVESPAPQWWAHFPSGPEA